MAIIKIRNAAIDLDAAEIPNLPATKITSGIFDNARISLDAAEIPNLDTAKITTGTLADARVPNLNASKITAGIVAAARLGSGTANATTFLRGDNTFAEAGGGKIGQVVSETKTSTFSSTSDTMVDISGLAVAITPSASSSKVFVMVNFNVSTDLNDRYAVFQLVRGSTVLSVGAGSGSRTVGSVAHVRLTANGSQNQISEYSINFLDAPSTTNATTYKMQGLAQTDGNPSFRLNMSGADSNAAYGFRLASTITVMEVLA